MVTGISLENFKTWRQAAAESTKGSVIHRALQYEMRGPVGVRLRELVDENAQVIRSMPLSLTNQITERIARRQQEGIRAATVAGELGASLPRFTRAHIRLIARTEVSKASTALIQARAEELDLEWYIWRTSEDVRVRPSHRHMEGVLIRWTNPASPERLAHEKHNYGPYAPGNIFNCRCYAQPLLRLEDVKWPHKVFYAERIQYMTRSHFANLFVRKSLAA